MYDVIRAQLEASEASVAACAAQLDAARANVVAARLLFDQLAGMQPTPSHVPAATMGRTHPPGVCEHPAASRTPCGTMADPNAWFCDSCGHIEQKEDPHA